MSQLQGYVTAEDNPRTAEMEAGSETRLGQPIVRAILKAGLAVIGKLGANSGVDIGDVTVNNAAGSGAYVQPGTSTTWDVSDRAARDLGKVDVATFDQYTPVSGRLPVDGSGVTQPVSGTVTADQGAAGAAAWPVSEADGANVAIGAVADAAVTTDTTGTLSGKLRGLIALWLGGLKAGEAHVGEVGGNTITVTVTPTLTVAGAYISGDFVGTSATAGIIANAARVAGKGGVLESVSVIDGDLQSVAGELWLFDTAVTPPADNAAWTISDADAATVIPGGVIAFSTYYASALNSVAVAKGVGLSYTCPVTSLYFVWVTRGAPTYTSGKLSFRFNFMRD